MNKITFFTKEDCPLCDAAWFVINKLRDAHGCLVERVDITATGNEMWYDRYADHIPVVHLNGREVARHRVSERQLRALLDADSDTRSSRPEPRFDP